MSENFQKLSKILHKIMIVFRTSLETSSNMNFENRYKIVEVIEF